MILYLTARRFRVYENPKIGEIEELLPGANCGACGRNGCHDFAVACVDAPNLGDLMCPSCGKLVMDKIAEIIGTTSSNVIPKVAVIHCNGSCSNRPKLSEYDGPPSCNILHSLYMGSYGCAYGCLAEGDCVKACRFDAISMNSETGSPEVNGDNCVGCGLCAKVCPRHIIEMRSHGPKNRRVYVACSNKEKGAIAIKECKVAC